MIPPRPPSPANGQTLSTLREEDLLRLGLRGGHARKFMLHLPTLAALRGTARRAGPRTTPASARRSQ